MVFSDRHIQTVELTGLEPDSDYRFRVHRSESGKSSAFYSFRTMPEQADRPIRIIFGGDIRTNQARMETTNRQAARFDPDLIVWGGDCAYADGNPDRLDNWYSFFDACMNTLIRDDGRVIPILVGIGNHEVRGGYYRRGGRSHADYRDTDAFREEIAPFYYNIFAFPSHPGYATLDFGEYMSIILLDTDHSGPIAGRQTSWLEEQLAARRDVPHVFPVYHVPAYPSARRFDGTVSKSIREHWAPLFDQYDLRLAFENHDHAYKRTVPIRDGEPDPDGVTYFGDGAWGVGLRDVHPVDETWYLERAESIRHLILATVHGDSADVKVISEDGELIDHYIPKGR